MKYLLLAVVGTLVFSVHAAPAEIQVIIEISFNVCYWHPNCNFVTLQSNLIFAELVPAFFQEDDDDVDMLESPDKRNSELLNSLLALPGGIHRSGK